MTQSQREKACRYNYSKGIWSKSNCQLCMRMQRENCSLLKEVNEIEEQEKEHKFDDRRDLAREEVIYE